MKPFVLPLIQSDFLKEEKIYKHRDTERKDHRSSNSKPFICKTMRDDSRETKSVNTLILDFQLPELYENKFLLKPPSMWCFVLATLAN